MQRRDWVDRYFAVRDRLAGSEFSGLETMEPRVLLSSAALTQVKVRNAFALEGDSNAPSRMFFVVKRTGDLSGTTVARYRTVTLTNVPNAALPGSELAFKTGKVRFAPGQTKAIAKVNLIGDELPESDAAFGLQLFKVRNAKAKRALATGVIRDDDTGVPGAVNPNITINDVSRVEGNASSQVYAFTVSLSQPTTTPVTVDYNTSNGSAKVSDNDYEPATGTLTFAPGVTTQTVNVTVNGDTTAELDETFFVNLAGASGAFIIDAAGKGTIQNDDGAPSMRVTDASIAEGNAGTRNLRFTVSISGALDETISVDYTTAGITATEGTDFQGASGTLTFEPGQTSKTIDVAINGDLQIEKDETFVVSLSNLQLVDPSDEDLDIDDLLTLAGAEATGTIRNDDAAPTLTISDVSKVEGNAGTTAFVFNLTLNSEPLETATVQYRVKDGSATDADNDFNATTGTVTFAPGETLQTITINVNGDTKSEGNEDFFVELFNPQALTLGDNQGKGVILNDDAAPTLSIEQAVSVDEGDTGTKNLKVTVTLSEAAGSNVTVNYATANGTATAGSDYTATSGTLTFSPTGPLTREITIPIVGDLTPEADELFFVRLTGATNAVIADSQSEVTINDDDGTPVVSVTGPAPTAEGDAGLKEVTFNITVSGEVKQPITVNYATANGTATTAGNDYQAKSGSVTFVPGGPTSIPVKVNIVGDFNGETDETFFLNLTNPTGGAVLGTSQAQATIQDDDDEPFLIISDVSKAEGNSGTTLFRFKVTLSEPTDVQVRVNYDPEDGTATTADQDYIDQGARTLFFNPGETVQYAEVEVRGDTNPEGQEDFKVTLSDAVNATIQDGDATGFILDDDPAPTLTVTDAQVTEGDAGTKLMTFTVALNTPVNQTVTVDYATADAVGANAALAGSDYVAKTGTLTFTPGQTSKQVTVTINSDVATEPDEVFDLLLSNVTGPAVIGDGQGVGTIVDND